MSLVSTEEMLIEKIEALKNKESYYKLKRFEKKELKALRKQLNQIKEEKRILEEENKKRLQKLEEERKAHLQKLEEERKAHLQKLEEERKAHLKELEEKDKKRNEEKKKEILKKQLESRTKASSNSQKKDKGEVIKDMCILSDITKKEIIEEKKNNPDKFIKTEEALKCPKESSVFVMGLLAKHLENNGITTAIEKNINQNDLEEGNTTLQFMVNGLGQKTRYNLHFDIGEERNEELLYNEEEQRKFIDKLKKKLSKEYKISEDDIIITNPQRGSFQLSVIFKSDDFNLSKEDLLKKLEESKGEPEYSELSNLKDIQKDLLLSACKINEKLFDHRGNNTHGGWGYNEKRGGEPYTPPEGWIGYGLTVWDKYDVDKEDKKNDWLSYDNREGEWCIAYHGAGHEKGSDEVASIIGAVSKSNLKQGQENDYADDDDIKHPGKKVGNGVYCSPNPKVMEGYAGIICIGQDQYKMGFMVRVNPEKIRVSAGNPEFWILDGNDDDIRPYRILVKKI
jgi:hypothetical protein